jgi:hypothetical protein
MSDDYKLVLGRCKHFEQLLEERFGAQGRGLHERVTSVQNRLPERVVKRLRFIATIRNKLVHEGSSDSVDDRGAFIAACDSADRDLQALVGAPSRGKLWLVLLVLLAAAAIGAWLVARFR